MKASLERVFTPSASTIALKTFLAPSSDNSTLTDAGSSFGTSSFAASSFGASAAASSPSGLASPSAGASGMGSSSTGASSMISLKAFGAALNHLRNSASDRSPLAEEYVVVVVIIDVKRSSMVRFFVLLAWRSMASTDSRSASAWAATFELAESRSWRTSWRHRLRRGSVRRVVISNFLALGSALMMALISSSRLASKPLGSVSNLAITALAEVSALSIIFSASAAAFPISSTFMDFTLLSTGFR
mmetsp:Transcript_12765/g.33723  ORF Transcript_12765/g.33723 Transcript_12765/m.33723 type:complete len:245 (+) Transcript_12765:677-1411(+)